MFFVRFFSNTFLPPLCNTVKLQTKYFKLNENKSMSNYFIKPHHTVCHK